MTTPHRPPSGPPPTYPYQPPQAHIPPAGQPPGMPPNMWPPQHRQHLGRPPYPATYQPPAQPQPAPKLRHRNPAAIFAVVVAVAGLILSGIPVLRAMCGLVAVVLGVYADRMTRLQDAPLGKLGLLGAVIGMLEIIALVYG